MNAIPVITLRDRLLLKASGLVTWPAPMPQNQLDSLCKMKATQKQNARRREANAAKRQNKEPAHPLGNAGSIIPLPSDGASGTSFPHSRQ